jgi:plastocyanin
MSMVARTFATTADGLRRAARLRPVQVLALASFVGMTVSAATPVTHTVVMKATSFAPLTLTLKLGDAVVWRNDDLFPHTATAEGVFDSKSIAVGASWKYQPKAVGEYVYICTFHPNMKGTLKVE